MTENTQQDADGYYGDEDMSADELDLSFLDQDQDDDETKQAKDKPTT